ncbi:uncharacterized protein SAPINGB_P005976 [Magnusiomyces paraingens]|uniref:Uncharacterized protein n=1 Tax=Magnusiomyces paraingens TaxID=2606893 RepID=A0A5E8C7T5_9ASCO|nr:uncharacterized protein SAPINGB_P005976 [Saprochaete ingens]VVT57978.1 unnamed protein product [Saprochaete ingens]
MSIETCVQTRGSQHEQFPLWSSDSVSPSWPAEQINTSKHSSTLNQHTSPSPDPDISPIDFVVEQAPPPPSPPPPTFLSLNQEASTENISDGSYSSSSIDLQVLRLLSHPAARCLFLPVAYPTHQSRATTTPHDLHQAFIDLPHTLLLPTGNLAAFESPEYRRIIRHTAFYRALTNARESGTTPKRNFAVVLPLQVLNHDEQQQQKTWATVVLLIRPGSCFARSYYGFCEKSPLLPSGSEVSPEYIQSAHGADLSGLLLTFFPKKCRVSTRATCLFPINQKQDSGIACALTAFHMTRWPALKMHLLRPRLPEGLSYSQLYELLCQDLTTHLGNSRAPSSQTIFTNHNLPYNIFPAPIPFTSATIINSESKSERPRIGNTVKQLETRLRHIEQNRMRFEQKRARLTARSIPQGSHEAGALRARVQRIDHRIELNCQREDAVRWALQRSRDNGKNSSIGKSSQRIATRRKCHRSAHRDTATRELEKLIGKMNIG